MNDYEDVYPLTRPSWIGKHLGWVRAWWFTRSWRRLPFMLPFVLVMGLFAVILQFGLITSDERTVAYLKVARKSLESGDYPRALVCFDAISYFGDDKPEVLFGLAQAAEGAGQKDRAIGLMTGLAPLNKSGYPEAHVWWAKRILGQPDVSAEDRAAAERHLMWAIASVALKDRSAAEGLLGELCLETGRSEKAVEYFTQASRNNKALKLQLARALKQAGKPKEAIIEAEKAASFFRDWLNLQRYAVTPRLQLADTLILLDDHPGAVAALKEGLDIDKDDRYRKALARVYLSWATRETTSAKPDVGQQFARLQTALEYDPANVDLLTTLWSLTKNRGLTGEKAVSVLQTQLAKGNASAMAHLALGMHAWDAGVQHEALFHLEQAYLLSPQMPLVGKNLAWVLANANPPELDRALGLANSLLERWPEDPTYRDTRAFVFARMGRWKDALVDLQLALPRFKENPAFHARLAEAYGKLGVPAMAAEHRREAEGLAEKDPKRK